MIIAEVHDRVTGVAAMRRSSRKRRTTVVRTGGSIWPRRPSFCTAFPLASPTAERSHACPECTIISPALARALHTLAAQCLRHGCVCLGEGELSIDSDLREHVNARGRGPNLCLNCSDFCCVRQAGIDGLCLEACSCCAAVALGRLARPLAVTPFEAAHKFDQ